MDKQDWRINNDFEKPMEYKNPKPVVDIIIELENHPGEIVLIERKNAPLGLALPGGFVDEGEKYIDAAAREAMEEVNLMVTGLRQFHTYTDPKRDPRGHHASTVYIGQAIGSPMAQDDAKHAHMININNPSDLNWEEIQGLCFDHAKILTDYLVFKRTGERPTSE